MQIYDFLMLLVLVGATLFGFWKGMAWQIASLASFFASYLVALNVSPQLAPMFGDQAPLNRFLAMLTAYVVTSFVIWVLFRLVAKVIDRVQLKEFDRQLGGLFGFAKGVLFCVAITLFAVTLLPDEQRHGILNSRSGYYIAVLLDQTHQVIPDELHEVLDPYLNKAEEKLDPNSPQNQPQSNPQNPYHAPPQVEQGGAAGFGSTRIGDRIETVVEQSRALRETAAQAGSVLPIELPLEGHNPFPELGGGLSFHPNSPSAAGENSPPHSQSNVGRR